MTTNTANTNPTPKCQQWRGLGRAAYRAGKTASQAVAFARAAVTHELDGCERKLVMAGWRSERSDAVADAT